MKTVAHARITLAESFTSRHKRPPRARRCRAAVQHSLACEAQRTNMLNTSESFLVINSFKHVDKNRDHCPKPLIIEALLTIMHASPIRSRPIWLCV